MKQENKELLFRDLCARVPYGVKVQYMNNIFVIDYISSYEEVKLDTPDSYTVGVSEVKPYLFPLSSMTEEQTKELINLINTGQNDNNEFMRTLCRIEFYHKHHFDYRGLIYRGLALDATGLNIY
ncbi:MAG: hypothetical protein MSA89_04350 [Clostridium sp.]|nr:hypothetical protein [Clostridium sp.]